MVHSSAHSPYSGHFKNIPAPKEIDENTSVLIFSNKGILKLSSGERIVNPNTFLKRAKLKDLIEQKGAEKIAQYIEQQRFGYVDSKGVEHINKNICQMIRDMTSKVNESEKASPTVKVFLENVEEMSDDEYYEFIIIVAKVVSSASAQAKEAKEHETSSHMRGHRQGNVVESNDDEQSDTKSHHPHKKHVSNDDIKNQILKRFAEAAQIEKERRDEAYKEKQIKQQRLKKLRIAHDQKIWDIKKAQESHEIKNKHR